MPSPLRRRLVHHAALATGSVLVGAVAAGLDTSQGWSSQLSFATAWICLVYMAVALVIGPVTARRRGSAPLNNYLRRDVGIWCALTGLAHFFLGVDQSMNPVYLARYVTTDQGLVAPEVAQQFFTWGSIAGLVVAVIILVPLCISSDFMLRRLGPVWWKRLQRTAVWAFGFTIAHGLAFQLLESRSAAWIALLVGLSLAVIALRLSGRRAGPRP